MVLGFVLKREVRKGEKGPRGSPPYPSSATVIYHYLLSLSIGLALLKRELVVVIEVLVVKVALLP